MCYSELESFGIMERQELIKIFQAWNTFGLPDNFSYEGIKAMTDLSYGDVMLVNDEYQECRLTDKGKLEIYEKCECCDSNNFEYENLILSVDGCNKCK